MNMNMNMNNMNINMNIKNPGSNHPNPDRKFDLREVHRHIHICEIASRTR